MKIAVIGAGIAGLSCADSLVEAGYAVTLFDKGRGPGGRVSTRRVETSFGQACFDHGAQYFTVRNPGFARKVSDWRSHGVVAPWHEAGTDAWVGVPGMSAVVRQMASHHDVEFSFLAKALIRKDRKWQIVGEQGARSGYDGVVVAIPAEQAASILLLSDFQMAQTALLARSQPCWTAMFAFAKPVSFERNIVKDAGPIAWAARNNAKPGRGAVECWVVQANATWSTSHLESTPDSVEELLRLAFERTVGAALPDPICSATHRWRYALSSGAALGSIWNDALKLGVCGDWLLGPRIECAWLSGQNLGARIAETVTLTGTRLGSIAANVENGLTLRG